MPVYIEGDHVRDDISQKIIKFFQDFSRVEAEVIDVKPEGEGMKALCVLPDGEYQVTLDKDLSVRAFYRKKPYQIEEAKAGQISSQQPEVLPASFQDKAKKLVPQPLKRPSLSKSEKAVLLIIKEHPGLTSYEIRQYVDMKFAMLLPILKKLMDLNIIQKQNDRYYPL